MAYHTGSVLFLVNDASQHPNKKLINHSFINTDGVLTFDFNV